LDTGNAAVAERLFGDRFAVAARYAELLATEGVVRGLIGPREAPRIWDRHVLNCAVVGELIPTESFVIDVGSGAGLPGIVLTLARPDLTVTLVEPLARRTTFLAEAVSILGLADRVRVVRARAEECAGTGPAALRPADVVTARAVAPLDRLAGWCLPLTAVGGRVLAFKSASVVEEVAAHSGAVSRLGGGAPTVHLCGVGLVEPPATVVEIVRERVVAPAASASRGGSRRRRGTRKH